jgi:putative photosynthetic complex assembly protein
MSGAAHPVPGPWRRRQRHPGDVPLSVLLTVGFVLAGTTVIAALGDKGHGTQYPAGTPVAQRSLMFEDKADGSIVVHDAPSGNAIAVLAPNTNGFIRTTMRGISHAGAHEFAVPAHAVLLTLWNDGRLTLDDPLSGRHLELEAFGKDNAGAYAALLTGRGL